MDTGNGNFMRAESMQELEKATEKLPDHGGIFTVGEKVELKGSLFRVKSIKPNELRLKLLKRSER
jgi:uncharacterized Zn finger protein